MSDNDPFETKDTKSDWRHSERRESHRVERKAKVRPVDDDEGTWTEAACTLSLSGVFFIKDVLPPHLQAKALEIKVDLEEEGELSQSGSLVPLDHRNGMLLQLDDLEFEESRQLARFLDEHKPEEGESDD